VGLRPNSPGAFAFALGCVVIATLLRLALTWAGDNILPFACYFPAVLLAALVGGLLAGVFAIALSLTIVAWAFFPPYYVFAAPTSEQVTNLALYALVSLLAIWATESGRRALIRWRIQVDLLGILAPMLVSLAAVLLTTIVLASIDSYIDVQELVLAYLFPTTLIAIAYGSMLAFLASFASGLAAAYFLFPPKLSLYIADPLHVAELGFFLLLALLAAKVASSLADDLRHEKKVSRRATRTRGAD
jgi:K+-sensing histidine kinase KdpD